VISSCTLDGDVRTTEMTGVGTVQERILQRDPDAMLLEYSLINRPTVTQHHATLQVLASGRDSDLNSGCELRWSTQIEPDALSQLVLS